MVCLVKIWMRVWEHPALHVALHRIGIDLRLVLVGDIGVHALRRRVREHSYAIVKCWTLRRIGHLVVPLRKVELLLHILLLLQLRVTNR